MQTNTLVCDICYNDYDSKEFMPMSLPCGHTYCLSCCRDFVACPFDKKPFAQHTLVTNYTIYRMFGEKEQRLQQIGGDLLIEGLTCPTHKSEKTLFCSQEKAAICADCFIFGEHKGHKVEKIDILLSKYAALIKSLSQNKPNFNIKDLFDGDAEYMERTRIINLTIAQSTQLIEEQFTRFIEKVYAVKDDIIAQVQDLYLPAFDALINAIKEKEDIITRNKKAIDHYEECINYFSKPSGKISIQTMYKNLDTYDKSLSNIRTIEGLLSKNALDPLYSDITYSIHQNIQRAIAYRSITEETNKEIILNKIDLVKSLSGSDGEFFTTKILIENIAKIVSDSNIERFAKIFSSAAVISVIKNNETTNNSKCALGDEASANRMLFMDGLILGPSPIKVSKYLRDEREQPTVDNEDDEKIIPKGMKVNVRLSPLLLNEIPK